MKAQVRQKLEMAARVRIFSRTHPSDQPEYAKVLGELEERLTRAETVAGTQEKGSVAARAARIKRQELRRAVHFQLLHYLVAVGGVAAKSRAELGVTFRLPQVHGSTHEFLTAVRSLVASAEEHKTVLLEKGMGPTLLDEIRRLLGEIEAAWDGARAGRSARVGAVSELDEIARDVMGLVRVLDGFNRIRFAEGSEGLAAWQSAKHMPVSRRVGGDGEAPPVDGGVAPAA